MFVSFIQFSFDPYLDQFEARQDQPGPGQAWRTEDESHCVVSGLSSLSLIPSPIHLCVLKECWSRVTQCCNDRRRLR